jgi:hypothetical protein
MREFDLRPKARSEGLVIQELADEALVYDKTTDVAHCLTSVAAQVWKGCDGTRDLRELARFTGADDDLVASALAELRDKELLDEGGEDDLAASSSDFGAGLSRRVALGRLAKYGAGATAVPLVISAFAASPASAMTGAACSGTSLLTAPAALTAATATCNTGGGPAETCNCTPSCTVIGVLLCTCTGTCV